MQVIADPVSTGTIRETALRVVLLPGTVGTDDGNDLTGVDIEADPVQGLYIAV
jgi:hypothetical protein